MRKNEGDATHRITPDISSIDRETPRRDQSYTDGDGLNRLEEVMLQALGEQTADITYLLNKWFEHACDASNQRPRTRFSAPLQNSSENPVLATSPANTGAHISDAIISSVAETGPKRVHFSPPAVEHGGMPEILCSHIAAFDLSEGWGGWRYHQAVAMREGGVVEIRQSKSTPGIISDFVNLPRGGLIRISVQGEFSTGSKGQPRPHLRVTDECNKHLGPDSPLSNLTSEHFFFASHRTERLKLAFIVCDPKEGYTISLSKIIVEHVDHESYFARQQTLALAPSIASLASIPDRREMLRDCVDSLLLQCERVRVFLNNYLDVPDFLAHPRVEIRRSQDWDDKGDAGKFGWIEVADAPGYRIIVDDDLIFPPDFVQYVSAKVNACDNTAIVAMHGVILKQPLKSYYDPECRSVFHFQNMLGQDRTCHVLGTNALCFYSESVKMTWADFMFRNMADIFLARYAQAHRLPMITPARPQHWVRQNSKENGFETIYENSLNKTRSKFDSSLVQDALVKWIAPLTLQPTGRPKVIFALIGTSDAEFSVALAGWEKSRWLDYDWVVLVTAGTDDPKLRSIVASTKASHEVHVVDHENWGSAERVQRLLELTLKLGSHAFCVCTDNVRFKNGSWTRTALGICSSESDAALFVTCEDTSYEVRRTLGSKQDLPLLAWSRSCAVEQISKAHFELSDGLAVLQDWSIRLARLNVAAKEISAKDTQMILGAIAGSSYQPIKCRGEVGLPSGSSIAPKPSAFTHFVPPLTINELFEQTIVINLDRRQDRWKAVTARLAKIGVISERYPAIDGKMPDVEAEYKDYLAAPLVAPPNVRRINSKKQFYQDYDSEFARLHFIENKDGCKAIQSAGAWGYLKTWERILERVLRDRIRTTLVLDDDVAFHRNSPAIFAAAVANLPSDWLILQLGTLQYEWRDDWMSWRTPFLYQTNGSAIGSHAVGIHFDIAPFLLEHVKRMLLPFDTGALSMATRAFKDRCFVMFPNIAIQALDDESDISTSSFLKQLGRDGATSKYRWEMEKYL